MSSPRLNVVSTTDATEDTEGQIITPVMAVVKKSYAYGENGFLEFGAGTDGALPFRVDDAGNVTAAGVTASTGPGAAAVAQASAYPLTITDVTAATLALAGQSITPAAGMAFRFEMWGTVTTTADTQTLNFGVYLGGIAGTAVNTTGVLKPNASATVSAGAIRVTGTITFLSATEATTAMQVDLNYFPVTVSQDTATVSGGAGQELVLGITPSADAVSVTINGGYWQRIA